MNTPILMLLCVVLAVPSGVIAAPTTDPPPPRVVSAGFETMPSTGDPGRDAAALGRRFDGPVWAGWAVPVVAGDRTMCCFHRHGSWKRSKQDCCSACRLEDDSGTFISESMPGDHRPVLLEPATHFYVLMRVDGGTVGEIRSISEECALDAGSVPFVHLTDVAPRASIAYLASFFDGRQGGARRGDDVTDEAVTAIALHDAPEADEVLDRTARDGAHRDAREQAIFWLGAARGERGYGTLTDLLRRDRDRDIREKVVFAISQSPAAGAVDLLLETARSDRDPEVRGEAIFWLAQEAADRAVGAIAEAIEKDPEVDVRRAAVFALSQLPMERGVPLLIEVARTHPVAEIRREAIFWLGEAEDPRALEFIESILKG